MAKWLKILLPKWDKKEGVFILVLLIFCGTLLIIPTGFEKQIYVNAQGVRAKVLGTDDSGIYKNGLILQGSQNCQIRILNGDHKGQILEAVNLMTGKMEFDKVFKIGDVAHVLLEQKKDKSIIFANMVDYDRIGKEMILVGLFALVMIIFSGYTGVRTLLSFAFALLCIGKLLIPGLLHGFPPLLLALLIGNLITVVAILLVSNISKKSYCAIGGSIICSLLTCLMAVIFVRYFKVNGAVLQWSESLLYAGFGQLDLNGIFQAGIYLASSGAIMDLSVDIAAALDEVVKANPKISSKELLASGLNIGRSVVGSQTTTLLLAYMGSYITVMMVYMAQGTPMSNILTSRPIAAEVLHTFVGCMGLVLVSPITALICSRAYTRQE